MSTLSVYITTKFHLVKVFFAEKQVFFTRNTFTFITTGSYPGSPIPKVKNCPP